MIALFAPRDGAFLALSASGSGVFRALPASQHRLLRTPPASRGRSLLQLALDGHVRPLLAPRSARVAGLPHALGEEPPAHDHIPRWGELVLISRLVHVFPVPQDEPRVVALDRPRLAFCHVPVHASATATVLAIPVLSQVFRCSLQNAALLGVVPIMPSLREPHGDPRR